MKKLVKKDDYKIKVCEMSIKYNCKVKASERTKADTSNTLYEVFKSVFDPDTIDLYESAYVALLNNKMDVLGVIRVGEGATSYTIFNLKKAMQAAILCNASAMVLCHNHPSGSLQPSNDDKKITGQAKGMCNVMQIRLLDHLIITEENYFSFHENGMM